MSKNAVVLLNLGGPDSLDAVQPFLFNLFSDPDIFNIPFGQKIFANLISKNRAPRVKEEYKLVGGNSPINKWTELQRNNLEESLKSSGYDMDVYVAMRYWNPLTEETVKKIESQNYDKIVLLPLYPHYSITTTGSSFNEWKRWYKGDKSKLVFVEEYYLNDIYIKAINERIDEALKKFTFADEVQLVFSAHGTPVSLVKKGDPYSHQIKDTVEAVVKARNYSHQHHLCFQSKVGPMKWLEPSTDKMIEKLASESKYHLLIIPISFVSDHVETLFELDIEYRHIADNCNIERYIVMEGLNDSTTFIEALKYLTINSLKKI
ncbi:MAG: ferrochelatase [Melioribacteraceae bacterium]